MTFARDASGEPSASSAPGHAWRPMSNLSLPGLATGLARASSPALAPASGFCSCGLSRLPSGRSLSGFRCRALAWPRPRSFTGHKSCGLGAFAVSAALPISQVLGLSGFTASLPSVNEPTCLWPKPPACRLQMGAWTDVTAILGIKTPVTSRPCGFPFRLFCVPKTS